MFGILSVMPGYGPEELPVFIIPPVEPGGGMAHLAKPRPDEKELAVWSVNQIRKYGGVLEHPRASKLWPFCNLPKPGSYDEFGGFTVCVDQHWWGHLAKKNSLLYICGCKIEDLPAMPLCFDAIEYTISSRIKKKSGRRAKKEVPKSYREKTPLLFAHWLIAVAGMCNK